MTGRDVLEGGSRRMRRTALATSILAIAALVIGLSAAQGEPFQRLAPKDRDAIVLGCFLAAALVVGGAIRYCRTWSIRCPWCNASLNFLLHSNVGPSRVKCCPFCEKSLDEEAPPRQKKPSIHEAWDEIA